MTVARKGLLDFPFESPHVSTTLKIFGRIILKWVFEKPFNLMPGNNLQALVLKK